MSNLPLTGHLLAAVPDLRDPNFFRSVVLVFQHDQEGAAGLVLNRQLSLSIGEVAREAMQLEGDFPQPLFWGGPVEGPLMALHDSLALAEMQVLPGVFLSMQRENLQALIQRPQQTFRMFTGYSGWGKDQLDSEMADGGWLATPAMADWVFGDPSTLWRTVCEQIGKQILLPPHLSGPQPPTSESN